MSSLIRFSVSVEGDLLEKFDRLTAEIGYQTRSKAVADLMRGSLVKQEWKTGKEVAAVVVLVYDHHSRGLSNRLTQVQHDYHDLIISSQHVHLDHDNCLELVVMRGEPARVQELSQNLKTTRGVKYTSLAAASIGSELG